MNKTNKTVMGILVFTVLTSLGVFLTPVAGSWTGSSLIFHWPLVVDVAAAGLHLGAALLFVLALHAYKDRMRKAYLAIVASIAFIALGTVQSPFISRYDLWNSAWITHGGMGIFFLLSCVTGYMGARSFAGLIGTKTVLRNIFLVAAGSLALGFLATLLPHGAFPAGMEQNYRAAVFGMSWTGFVFLATFLLVLNIRRHIGRHYVPAMTMLAVATVATASVLFGAMFSILLSGDTQNQSTASVIVTFVAGVVWLLAGYVFSRAEEY